jgi:hypothetical protein
MLRRAHEAIFAPSPSAELPGEPLEDCKSGPSSGFRGIDALSGGQRVEGSPTRVETVCSEQNSASF